MRWLIITTTGDALPLASALELAGREVDVYIHDPRHRILYSGMLKNRIRPDELLEAAKRADHCFVDAPVRYDSSDELHSSLLKSYSNIGLFGGVLDPIRDAGLRVVGCSAKTDAIELKPERQRTLAAKLGFEVAETHIYNSPSGIFTLDDEVKWSLHAYRSPWSFVESWPGELREYAKVPGVLPEGPWMAEKLVGDGELEQSFWWDGKRATNACFRIESHRAWAGERGHWHPGAAGCLWSGDIQIPKMGPLESELKTAGYLGPVRVSWAIHQGKPIFRSMAFSSPAAWLYPYLQLLRRPYAPYMEDLLGGMNDEDVAAWMSMSCHQLRAGARISPTVLSRGSSSISLDTLLGAPGKLAMAGVRDQVALMIGADSDARGAFERALRATRNFQSVVPMHYRDDTEALWRRHFSLTRTGAMKRVA